MADAAGNSGPCTGSPWHPGGMETIATQPKHWAYRSRWSVSSSRTSRSIHRRDCLFGIFLGLSVAAHLYHPARLLPATQTASRYAAQRGRLDSAAEHQLDQASQRAAVDTGGLGSARCGAGRSWSSRPNRRSIRSGRLCAERSMSGWLLPSARRRQIRVSSSRTHAYSGLPVRAARELGLAARGLPKGPRPAPGSPRTRAVC